MSDEKVKATARQVGGDHYKRMAIQPIEFITANNMEYRAANIVKYACRHQFKNGAEDIKKLIHYAEMILEDYAKADTLAPDAERMDAEWPQEGDAYWTWIRDVKDFRPLRYGWVSESVYDRYRLARGEVFRTRAEAEAEWNRRHGKKEEPAADTAHELTDAEKQMVRDSMPIPAIQSLRARTTLNLKDAKAIVDAYRASIKASKPCPTGVPENGEWMPKHGERFWIAGEVASGPAKWMALPCDAQLLEDGDVCRTRAIARTVQRRRKAAGKAVAE